MVSRTALSRGRRDEHGVTFSLSPLATFFMFAINEATVILSEAKDLQFGGGIRSRDPSLRSG
jgi:hypothetical protein